ncbi:putative 2-hydroxy-acid oxidase [Diplodia seriata]|uniref:Oxidase FUB9 n=1 Tax=Diplodia seriata TaxID=420778 RepID=A0A0G2EZ27_9PEZI|nr:putative 2-hydroxy-acid oxidase [Diplodia seriata]
MAGETIPSPVAPAAAPAILSIKDLQRIASEKLPQSIREFYNDGSTDQVTVHENTTAYAKYRLRPRVLRDVSGIDPSTTVFGTPIAFPLCVSPAGLQAMAHPSGELATARACARRRVHMGISSYANHGIAQIRGAATAVWPGIRHGIQLYTMRDRAKQERIIRAAEDAGCTAILLTADSPVLGVRYNEVRGDFRTPAGLGFPIMERTSEDVRATTHDEGFASVGSDAHSWAEVAWLRGRTGMEIWIKGVLTAEDVRMARECGCDGVIVSNHGGRQLDGTPATIDALPECVGAAEGKIRVHIDGGIRSGVDVFKALALGAECCWVGRPMLWGLAHDGEAGVTKMLDIFYEEFKRCMQLTGCSKLEDISTDCLGIVKADGPLARL